MFLKREDRRIGLIGGLILAVLTLVSGFSVYVMMLGQAESILSRSLEATLRNNVHLFESQIAREMTGTLTVATRPFVIQNLQLLADTATHVEARSDLQRVAESFLPTGLAGVVFYDVAGNEVARAGRFAPQPELSVPLRSKNRAALVWRGEFILQVHMAIVDRRGHRVGATMTETRLPLLTRAIADVASIGATAELAVCAPLEQDMRCFPLTISKKVLRRLPRVMEGKPLPMHYALDGKSGVIFARDYRRKQVVAAHAPIGTLGLGMVLKIDQDELYGPVRAQLNYVIPLLALLVFVGMLLLYWRVTPLVRKLVSSERETQVANARLRESEAKLQAILDCSAVAIAWTDEQGGIEYINSMFTLMFGYTLDDVPTREQWYLRAYPEQAYRSRVVSRWEADVANAREQNTAIAPVELAISCKDSAVRHVILSGAWAGPRLVATFSDITARKQMEEQLLITSFGVENISDAAFWIRPDASFFYVNAAACKSLGYSRKELLSMGVVDIDPDFLLNWPDYWEVLQQKRHFTFESRHHTKDGRSFPVEISINYFAYDGQEYNCCFARDITERKRAEQELQLAAMVYQNSSEAMTINDEHNQIIAVNPAFTQMTGYTLQDVMGKNPSLMSSGRHDPVFFQTMWEVINSTGQWQGEIWDRRKNGEIFAKWLTINIIRDAAGAAYRYVALFSDITDKKLSEEMIWKQANFDTLTGLPNRDMFRNRLEQEVMKSARANLSLALLLIDLDEFNGVNDTLGHDVGDILLQDAARRICSLVRESDTVARLGGDEFAVILSTLPGSDQAGDIAQQIVARLSEPYRLGNEAVYLSASIGITLYPDDATEIDALIKNADQAMYAAKNQGRNRFSYFTHALQQAAQVRLRLGNDMRGALAAEQFRVYFQPIVELSTGRIHKAEALLRWQHPERGMVSPLDFIPLAEDTGLINAIGDWVFRESARYVQQWRQRFAGDFQVSVNMSPVQFKAEGIGLAAGWLSYLQSLGLAGKDVVIEITEGLLMDATQNITDKLLAFRDAGIQVAIDDFGTGYSSLSYLKVFDIDYLKIDRSFVGQLETDENDLVLCEAIIVMAHRLGLKVIAEGVETEGQRALLRDIGCDYAQGYLFSRPLPPEAFETLLPQHNTG